MSDCTTCGRPQRADTAVVCTRCADQLACRLHAAAGLWPDLLTTCAGQARMGEPGPRARGLAPAQPIRPGRGDPAADQQPGWPTGLPVPLAAAEVRDAVRNTVTTWVRHIATERGAACPVGTTPTLLRWLASQTEWLRHQPYADEALDELGYAAGRVEPAVDRPRPRVDAGLCLAIQEDGSECQQRLSAPPGAREIHCPSCGGHWDAGDRRELILAEARKLMATQEEIAAWLSILVEHTKAATVRRWVARGQLIGAGGWYPFDRAVVLRTELWMRRGLCRSTA